MKNITRAVSLMVGVLVWISGGQSAMAQTFGIQVQARSPNLPTGQVKMTLETSGPVSGSTVTVSSGSGGPTTVTVPGSGSVGTDQVLAVPQSDNPNNLVILFVASSQFTSATNFCSLATGKTGAESASFTFTGPTINAYRMNSYTAASTLDCGQAYVRVDSSPAVWSPAPPGTNNGRNPLDIVFVLDNSGSMSLPSATPTPAPPWDTRWNALNKVVQMFLSLWAQSGGVSTGGNPVNGNPSDRVGLVFYSTDAEPASLASGIFERRDATSPSWTDVESAVQSQGPTNLTAIGKGLIEAICDAQNGTNKSTNDVELILMTDGLQNVSPMLQVDPTSKVVSLDFSSSPITACQTTGAIPLYKKHITTQTVALGTPGTVDTDLLNYISAQTAGSTNMALTIAEMTAEFTDTLMDALKGNTLDLNLRAEATLDPSAKTSGPMPLLLDGSVIRTTFVLGWQNQREALDLQITSPSGTTVTPTVRQDDAYWTVQSIDIPASGAAGNWSVQVVRRSFNAGAVVTTNQGGTPYFLSAYSVEGKLGYRFTFSSGTPGTGDAIGLRAEVSYSGKPLTALGNGIKVQIQRPDAGLGTILFNSQVPADVLNNEPDPHDSTTPYQRKVAYLTANNNLISQIAPQPLPTDYVMRDDGSGGDAVANDGTYTASFADTSKPGLYKFKVTMDWNNATTGVIHREETLQTQVEVNPDPSSSAVTVVQGSSPGQWIVNVTPKDKFGNYLGPGYANAFQVQVNGTPVTVSPTDGVQTGAYGITLNGIASGTNPVVSINVGGKQIRNAPLNKLQCPEGKKCCGPFKFPATMLLFAGVFAVGLFSLPNGRKRRG